MQRVHEDTTPWYRQFWPWFLIALPASVVVACIATVVIAFRSPISMVEDNYYKEGLAINRDLSSRSFAESLKLQASVRFQPNLLQIDLNQVGSENLELRLIHSTDSSLDHEFNLAPQGDRRFSAELVQPLSGRYRIELHGQLNGTSWSLMMNSPVNFSGQAMPESREIFLGVDA
ncbi:MAG: FixH family protein [Pseudomonadales bacterium]